MSKQQTAVEWLAKELIKYYNLNSTFTKKEIIEQANKMFEQQIIDAFGIGCHHESKRLVGYQDVAEQYYNENFGK